MAVNYDRQNDQLKGIQYQRASISRIVAGLDFNDNCIVTGGMDITFSNGAKVANRKLILENIIERLVRESNRPIVVFYKSPYLINQFSEWYRTQNTRRKCSVISSSMIAHSSYGDNRRLAPFGGMLTEEIIYTVKAMSSFMNIPFDQYSETFFVYLLSIIQESGYSLTFDNIMALVLRSDEDLSLLAKSLGLITASKFFAKSMNGSEIVKRVLKEMNNYFQAYYQRDCTEKINICSEVRNNNVLFIEIDDQYQTEMLEYFCNELKCCSRKCPYILLDDILIKNNPSLEDYLLQSTGLRFCMGAMDVAVVLSKDGLDDFLSQTQTKFLLHYDNATAAEKITASIGYYYHMKVSEEETANREAFKILNNSISKGYSVTDEKRLIIEGTDLTNLSAAQLFLIDSNSGRIFVDGLL